MEIFMGASEVFEELIRGFDDESLPARRVAKQAHSVFRINVNTAHHFILAKRNGYQSAYHFREIYSMRRGAYSFSQLISGKSNQQLFEESLITNYSIKNIPERQKFSQDNPDIFNLLKSLSQRERHVIQQLYFDNKTLVDISKEEGVSKQRIFDIENRALDKLKTKITKNKISSSIQ